MQRAAGGQKEPLVIVHADARTPHEAVVRVMEAARRLGYTHLSFATRPPAATDGGTP
jgi:biopolymer transport protein ExbD